MQAEVVKKEKDRTGWRGREDKEIGEVTAEAQGPLAEPGQKVRLTCQQGFRLAFPK